MPEAGIVKDSRMKRKILKIGGWLGLALALYVTFEIMNVLLRNINPILIAYSVECLLLFALYNLSIKMITREGKGNEKTR